LEPRHPPTDPPTWTLPELDPSWKPVLRVMRQPPEPDARPWDPPPPVKPVTFRAAHRLDAEAVQLHLGHPLVQRILSRFRAQGFAAHDLERVTVIENRKDALRRVVAFARLTLFGHGATRLHESLVRVSARVLADEVRPFAERADQLAEETLLDVLADAPPLHPSPLVRSQVLTRAASDYQSLWSRLQELGLAEEMEARARLTERGAAEALAMEALLERQRRGIQLELAKPDDLDGDITSSRERSQRRRERRRMTERLKAIHDETSTQPEAIRRGYDVALTRFEPVGLCYLWPTS